VLTQRAPNWGPFAFAADFEVRSGVEDFAGFRVAVGRGLRVAGRGSSAAAGFGLLEADPRSNSRSSTLRSDSG